MSSVAASLKRPLSTCEDIFGPPGEINLNDTEQTLVDFLLEMKREGKVTTMEGGINTDVCIRFVGGWVRDKLLGKESQDVDIALSNMTGAKFAECVYKYAKESGRLEVSRVGVIKVYISIQLSWDVAHKSIEILRSRSTLKLLPLASMDIGSISSTFAANRTAKAAEFLTLSYDPCLPWILLTRADIRFAPGRCGASRHYHQRSFLRYYNALR